MPIVDNIAQLHLQEHCCTVCGLPLPRDDSTGICSRRCASLQQLSREIQTTRRAEMTAAILQELSTLKRGSTICPGELSQRVLPGVQDPLRLLRPLLHALEQEHKIRLLQKGVVRPWRKIRGPFRVRLSD